MKWEIWHMYVKYKSYYNLAVIHKKSVLANLANYFPSVSNCASFNLSILWFSNEKTFFLLDGSHPF